ncbi:MAG: phage holin family protein [Kofleriaceae bacterium]|nr:phage holin family protein [Kofleriaceae bacterium]
MSDLAITTLVRVVVFTGIFALAAHKHKKISITPRYAIPLVGVVFALLNTGLYWLFKTIVGLATLGMGGLILPFVLNGLFLWGTNRVIKQLKIEGTVPLLWLSILLTAAHGALYLVFRAVL